MFVALDPLTLVRLSVLVGHQSKAISQSVFVLTSVDISVGPGVLSLTVFEVVQPRTFVSFSIFCLHGAFTLELVSDKISFKNCTFLHENPLSVSSVVEELSIVPTSIDIDSLSFAIGHVVLPLTFILVPCSVIVLSKSISYIVPKVAFKIAAVLLDIPSSAFASPVNELSL